ncbi:hypothetical protein ACQKL5_17075 [Peribacillus sp. NPDC097675]|uniref:hypothetical protein n=1 Tax=Peribacillus sp. NPDC097675 TaxID=3390618 RepID=UPI003D07B005
MFGTVEHFTDHLKAQIMRNLSAEKTVSLFDCHARLIEEIKVQAESTNDKKAYEANLEKAYNQVNLELFGHQESK